MPELTREEKLKLVEKLPQQLQDLLYSEDTGAFLLYLGQKYNLPDEKVRLLSKLVADVVLGIVPTTSLAQEINSKITSDAQAAMNLAQELNTELLAPVMTAPSVPPTPARPVDEYREPTASVPEVVDLRKVPTPAPTLPILPQDLGEIGTRPLTSPLTFTRPIQPLEPPKPAASTTPTPQPPQPPLIEAEPHKIPPLVSAPIPISTPPASEPKPQYIMRPSGAPPTDLPDNVLDLRKDRGEF